MFRESVNKSDQNLLVCREFVEKSEQIILLSGGLYRRLSKCYRCIVCLHINLIEG